MASIAMMVSELAHSLGQKNYKSIFISKSLMFLHRLFIFYIFAP